MEKEWGRSKIGILYSNPQMELKMVFHPYPKCLFTFSTEAPLGQRKAALGDDESTATNSALEQTQNFSQMLFHDSMETRPSAYYV